MENKINVAELLKDCPSDMELNCTMYEDVYFDYVDELNVIHCYIHRKLCKTSITFNQHGTPNSDMKSKCVIFPKGKTTWEGFVPPCKFNFTTLKPFDKVLIRNTETTYWRPAFFGKKMNYKNSHFITSAGFATYCIPYENN
jgi:hypothetical protein